MKLGEGKKGRVASADAHLYFLGESSKYRLPNGWLYPILAAFRANAVWDLKKSEFDWRVPNEEILARCLPDLVSVCVNEHVTTTKSPNGSASETLPTGSVTCTWSCTLPNKENLAKPFRAFRGN